MASSEPDKQGRQVAVSPIDAPNAFERMVENDDRDFYAQDRMVNHLDSQALETVENLIGQLIVEESPVILDLMAACDSHIPSDIRPGRVVGLGLNPNELAANAVVDEAVLHDLNRDTRLPFNDDTFDVVLNTVSVDYMTRPIEVFKEVARVLKPGGLFLVIFSNRMFPEKAVRIWRETSEDERPSLVDEFFTRAGGFEEPQTLISKGRKRPSDDKYAAVLAVSDPIFAVYAEKAGAAQDRRPRPKPVAGSESVFSPEEVEQRKKQIKETLACPHCGNRLRKWMVPDNPFGQPWENEYMYICFHDACPYYVRGWQHMLQEMNRNASYRLMYNPEKDSCSPIPVPSSFALRESIVDDEASRQV
jgi:SAM-dependent methyltransferase